MKKSYLMIAAAAALLTACSSNDTFKQDVFENETELIGFETYHGKSTRAAVNAGTDLLSNNGGFGVYGFKHLNSRSVNNGVIDLSDTDESDENYVTTVFDNVKVWYDANAATDKFTYAVPKYWDKLKKYTFFAYAPQTDKAVENTTQGISFDQAKGIFTRDDIKALQSTNDKITNAGPSTNRIQYVDSVESGADLKDYLMAVCVPAMEAGATNHSDHKNTVQFTFSHILSKLNVYVRVKDESGTNGHKYAGVKDIQVSKLNIQNLPNAITEIAKYAQTKADEVTGTWTPAKYTSTLNIIGGTNALEAGPLYILDGGQGSATAVTTNPTSIPQEFHYFVAPNIPEEDTSTEAVEGKYILNIDYTVNYVDNTADPFTRSIDLSTISANFTKMEQNNIYKIIITIGLDQIYFDVNTINNWVPNDNSNNTNVGL